MVPIVVALGSNIGMREANIGRALGHLGELAETQAVSGLYETTPLYVTDQPSFLNSVVLARTDRGPIELLRLIKAAEERLGRRQREANGPREIDIDLVAYGQLRMNSYALTLPHPRAAERRFVLEPWHEVDPHARLIGRGMVSDLLARPEIQGQVARRAADAPLSV